jgi:multidrug efflux pump subunit AcrA (membrane-fusion protein)
VYELSAAVGGKVVSVEVIEGQTVAELDDIVALDSARGPVLLATQVPGVVRELYVERNAVIEAEGADRLIDES